MSIPFSPSFRLHSPIRIDYLPTTTTLTGPSSGLPFLQELPFRPFPGGAAPIPEPFPAIALHPCPLPLAPRPPAASAAAALHLLLHHASPHRGQRGKSGPGVPQTAQVEVNCMSLEQDSRVWRERKGESERAEEEMLVWEKEDEEGWRGREAVRSLGEE